MTTRLPAALVPLLAALVGALVYRDTLAYYFSQDAFTVLARVRGLAELPGMGWRWISGDLYFRLGDRLFGLDPRPYRVLALLLHAGNAALVAGLARRAGLGAAAACFAGTFFAAHYAHFDALYSIAGAGELLAATFALTALVVALPGEAGAAARWRAPVVVACYAAALLSKENVLLLPVLLWLAGRLRPSAARAAVLPCAVLGVLYLLRFLPMNPFGVGLTDSEANPYRLHLGLAMLDTWSTYLAWALGLFDLRWGHLLNELGHESLGWWLTAAAAALLFLLGGGARRRGGATGRALPAATLGAAGYAAFILPVLPLASHAAHHYLYLPLGLLALALGAALEAWVVPRLPALVWLLALGVSGFGAVMVQSIEFARLEGHPLPRQGTVRRAVVAERVLKGLPAGPAALPRDVELLGPNALSPAAGPDTSALARYLFNDVAAALDEGRALRLRFPAVERVALHWDLGREVRAADVVVFDYDGRLKRGPSAWLYLRRAQVAWAAGRGGEAVQSLARADELASRWLREAQPASWRAEGAGGIRAQAETMRTALEAERPAPGDPRLPYWIAYRDALVRILGLLS